MKIPIIGIGYHHYAFDDHLLAASVLKYLSDSTEVSREYASGKYTFVPKEKDLTALEIIFVDKEDVRPLSDEELENKEIAALKSNLSYRDSQINSLNKELECLKAQLKTSKEEETLT